MAIETGSEAATLKARLLSRAERVSFFQAYRLLRRLGPQVTRDVEDIKFRPDISLGFPGRDVSSISERKDGRYQVDANFLGLYGVSSPLPNFYTEDLLAEQQQELHARRDFLDVVSQTIYPIFFRAWLKSKPHLRIVEFDDTRMLDIFYAFVGINQPEKYRNQPGFDVLLRFGALFTQSPRSALGLQTILSASYPDVVIKIIEQDIRTLNMPAEQHLYLGQQATILGVDTHLGSEFNCCNSNLTIEMRDVADELFRQLLPGGLEYSRLCFMVQQYLTDPLNVVVDLYLKQGVAQPVVLGQDNWSALGRDTWLYDGFESSTVHVRLAI